MASQVLQAQKQAHRSAAEALEIELANKRTSIALVPVDEKLSDTGMIAEPATTEPTEPADEQPTLRTGKDEKMAARYDPSQCIPEPPVDESQMSGQETVQQSSLTNVFIEQQKATEKPKLLADPAEVEAQQHQQNGIRAIPAPPKEEKASNNQL